MLYLKHNGETLLVREIDTGELKTLKRLKTSAYYNRLLGLIVNRRLSVNSFTGDISAMQKLILDMEELICRKQKSRRKKLM
jgi:hypothetical protein